MSIPDDSKYCKEKVPLLPSQCTFCYKFPSDVYDLELFKLNVNLAVMEGMVFVNWQMGEFEGGHFQSRIKSDNICIIFW